MAWAPAAHAADRLIGLLTLPEVFGDGPCEVFEPRELMLYKAPDSNEVVGTIRVDQNWSFQMGGGCEGLKVRVHRRDGASVTMLPTEEHGYEEPAAIVFEERHPWYRIRLSVGSAWVRASERDQYIPLQELVSPEEVHLTGSWDGLLRRTPGAAEGFEVPPDPRKPRIVGYLEARTTWTRVVLEPGENRDAVRRRYRADNSVVGQLENGVTVMDLEVGTTHPLFAAPDRQAAFRGEVRTSDYDQDLMTLREGSPDRVPVFSSRPGWYEVAFRSDDWLNLRKAWLETGPAWRFYPVADAREAEHLLSPERPKEFTPVRVLRFQTVGEALWLEVEVLSHSSCVEPTDPTTIARGWIPAHAASGGVTIWFSSRGC